MLEMQVLLIKIKKGLIQHTQLNLLLLKKEILWYFCLFVNLKFVEKELFFVINIF